MDLRPSSAVVVQAAEHFLVVGDRIRILGAIKTSRGHGAILFKSAGELAFYDFLAHLRVAFPKALPEKQALKSSAPAAGGFRVLQIPLRAFSRMVALVSARRRPAMT